ncbi:hypothetical protein BASA50_000017 [Batrachochytrium salamandrivorans]|uniref:IBR domain-containing protein n=1 Tax=Batrachochytrium salamandrivorans TaxID=1357716 RepID=A0ABQ8EUT9_9FUNG|nr:hypothetical protein BASA50_000017 [Batrachochytrium salamandrivorans]
MQVHTATGSSTNTPSGKASHIEASGSTVGTTTVNRNNVGNRPSVAPQSNRRSNRRNWEPPARTKPTPKSQPKWRAQNVPKTVPKAVPKTVPKTAPSNQRLEMLKEMLPNAPPKLLKARLRAFRDYPDEEALILALESISNRSGKAPFNSQGLGYDRVNPTQHNVSRLDSTYIQVGDCLDASRTEDSGTMEWHSVTMAIFSASDAVGKWLKPAWDYAEIDGFERCPFCDYGVSFELSADEEPVLRCQSDSCKKATCRKCKKVAHQTGETCEEGCQLHDDTFVRHKSDVEKAKMLAMEQLKRTHGDVNLDGYLEIS